MTEYRLTFGVQYAHEPHPAWDGAHPDGWVAIEAPDEAAARELAATALGSAWAFLYGPGEGLVESYHPRGEIGRLGSARVVELEPAQWVLIPGLVETPRLVEAVSEVVSTDEVVLTLWSEVRPAAGCTIYTHMVEVRLDRDVEAVITKL